MFVLYMRAPPAAAGAAAAPSEHSTEVLLNLEDRNNFLRIAHEAQHEATNELNSQGQARKISPASPAAPSKSPM